MQIVENPKATRAEPVVGLTDVAAIALADETACALTTKGDVLCWGANGMGTLGRGTFGAVRFKIGTTAPPPELAVSGAAHIAMGGEHACVVLDSGEVRCWGRGDQRQLGVVAPDQCANGARCGTRPIDALDAAPAK